MDLKKYIRNIPDFPQKGILFRDITPLLSDGDAFRFTVKSVADHFRDKGINKVAGIEARGFIIGAPIAIELVAIQERTNYPTGTLTESLYKSFGDKDRFQVIQKAVWKGR